MIPHNKCCIFQHGNQEQYCEYRGVWLCKNPDCIAPILTSTLAGAHPSGCPYYDKWNSKKASEKENGRKEKDDAEIH